MWKLNSSSNPVLNQQKALQALTIELCQAVGIPDLLALQLGTRCLQLNCHEITTLRSILRRASRALEDAAQLDGESPVSGDHRIGEDHTGTLPAGETAVRGHS